MELNWSTFLLEIINFLVLVWILKRFLYRPVLDVIARRRQTIEQGLEEARQMREEADTLKQKYEGRLADWDHERQQSRDELARELEKERTRQLAVLQDSLEQERQRDRAAEERQRAERQRSTEHLAMQQGAAFAGRVLAQACCPELEARLVTLLLEQLAQLPEEQVTQLRQQWGEPPANIEVSSAFALTDDQRGQLQEALQRVSGLSVPVQFSEDSELLAGLRIVIGSWVLAANVRDDLAAFAEFAHAPH